MSFAKSLIEDLMSKNVEFKEEVPINPVKNKEGVELEFNHYSPLADDPPSMFVVFERGTVPKDVITLTYQSNTVSIEVYSEIPGIEPIGLKHDEEPEILEIYLSSKGKALIVLPHSVKRSVHNSLRSYIKGFGYKTVNIRTAK